MSEYLRDLGDADFLERYGCDRFTATVLSNRFSYVVQHMCARLLTAAFSPVLRDFYDFAATLAGSPRADYPTAAMSNSILLFTGVMTDSVRNTIEEFGVHRLEPGDVIVANDPYRGGTHVNDILFIRPVFHEGEPVAFVNVKAHQLDMGGVVPGGFSIAKISVYENGLVMSPRALYKAGVPVHETWSMIFDNVRLGDVLFPDMKTVCAELELGDRLVTESIERYGNAAVAGAIEYVCDAAAERMSRALESIPDGVWEGEDISDCDAIDDDEEYRVRVRVTKRGPRAEVDFSGTSRQARTSINATALDAKTSVMVAFKYLFDPGSAFTSGATRCVDLVIPDQTVVSALPPHGVVLAYWEQSQVMTSALLRALAPAVGLAAMAGDRGGAELHNAHGTHPDGTPWISVGQCGGEIGPLGANRYGDAESQMINYQANGIAPPLEAIESEAPVVVLRHEIVPDTAGPGLHRGGAGLVRDSLWLEAADHHVMSLRFKRPPGFGVNGGKDGATGGVWLWEPRGLPTGIPEFDLDSYRDAIPVAGVVDPVSNAPSTGGTYVYPYSVRSWPTAPLARLRYVNNGGGGWGNPLERDPELVKRDVRDEYVTIEGAERDYGVVVFGDPENDPEGLIVDLEATRRLRVERSRVGRTSDGTAGSTPDPRTG